jgi:hypothetical protein
MNPAEGEYDIRETTCDPLPRERKVFALSLCALSSVFALLIWGNPASLLLIACASGIAWGASILLNNEQPLARQWKGVMVPIVVGLTYAAVRFVASPAIVAVAIAGSLTLLGVVVWLRDTFGNRFYRTWVLLFAPLAWSVSTLLLVLIYYVVLTPIAVAFRLLGRDPLQRNFDRNAPSYWVKRDNSATEASSYFRQF